MAFFYLLKFLRMVNYILPFLSIALGFAFVLIFKSLNEKVIKLLLSFSGAFLMAMTLYTLIPEVFHLQESLLGDSHQHMDGSHAHFHQKNPIGFWIVIGILIQIVLEFFSRGAEHGHFHSLSEHNESLSSFPYLLFSSLCLHSILEGFPLHNHSDLVYGISIHHFPISIILSVFFLSNGVSVLKTAIFILFFALSTPFGAFLADRVPFFINYSVQTSAIAIGVLLHISSVILFESSQNHTFNAYKLSVIILGFVLAYFS